VDLCLSGLKAKPNQITVVLFCCFLGATFGRKAALSAIEVNKAELDQRLLD
jgi:hypothetical protein